MTSLFYRGIIILFSRLKNLFGELMSDLIYLETSQAVSW